jgi:signal transduction histidine kinase
MGNAGGDMERVNMQLSADSFAHWSKFASYIIEHKLDQFTNNYFQKLIGYFAQSGLVIPTLEKQQLVERFKGSCTTLLEVLQAGDVEAYIRQSIELNHDNHFSNVNKNDISIDDIIAVGYIKAESLKMWIAEYTKDVNTALAITRGVDNLIATYNRIAFEKYSKQLLSALASRNDALILTNERLRDFAGIVSHDLKTPLRKISTYLELIQKEMREENSENNLSLYLTKTKKATAKMGDLIDQLLTFSSLDDRQFVKVHCDLQQVIEDVIENLEPSIREKNARVEVGTLPAIQAVPFQMNQLFQNLLSNSLKFCRSDLAPIVEISSERIKEGSNSIARIKVKDNCIGFKDEFSAKIFTVFTRLQPNKFEGSGLGLSICKKIVENHGGTISVTSSEDAGTTFTIDLPIISHFIL